MSKIAQSAGLIALLLAAAVLPFLLDSRMTTGMWFVTTVTVTALVGALIEFRKLIREQ